MATFTDMKINITVTNGTCNVSSKYFPLDTALNIRIQPNRLYGSSALPVLNYINKPTGKTVYKETFTATDTADVYELNTMLDYSAAKTTEIYGQITYSYSQKYVEIKNNLIQCSTSMPDGLYAITEHTITITADDNCEFNVTPKISYYYQDKTTVPWKLVYGDFEFNKVSDTEYTYTFTADTRNTVYTVNAEAVTKTDITDKYGLIALYKPDKDILMALSKIRFVSPTPKPVDVGTATVYVVAEEYIDTAQYVISLKKFYFNIDTVITENICLGPYNTEIQCPVIGGDIKVLDMGTIAIAGIHQNIMDYDNTELQMYLPFIGFIDLKTADFMDKAINLRYEINIITGDSIAVIYADNKVMLMLHCNVSFEVPYRLNFRDTVNNNLQANTNYLLSEKPFIYVKSYKPAMPNSELPYKDTKYYAHFNEVSGYVEATEIDFSVQHDYITKTEIDEVISLLENGVFF